MDTQEELLRRGGDYSLKDYSSKTAGDIAAGLVKRAGKPLFGEPLNALKKPKSLPFWVGDDKYLFDIRNGVKIYKKPNDWIAMDVKGNKYDLDELGYSTEGISDDEELYRNAQNLLKQKYKFSF